jgi:hypothetical protein
MVRSSKIKRATAKLTEMASGMISQIGARNAAEYGDDREEASGLGKKVGLAERVGWKQRRAAAALLRATYLT